MKNESLVTLLDLYVNHANAPLVTTRMARFRELISEEIVWAEQVRAFPWTYRVTVNIYGAAVAQAMLDAAKSPEVIPA